MHTRLFSLFAAIAILALASHSFAQSPNAATLAGDWSGTLEAGGQNLPIVFHVTDKGGAKAVVGSALRLTGKALVSDGSCQIVDVTRIEKL